MSTSVDKTSKSWGSFTMCGKRSVAGYQWCNGVKVQPQHVAGYQHHTEVKIAGPSPRPP